MDETLLEKIDVFFSKYKYQKYKKGEILIRAEDSPQGVFYLKAGNVKQYTISRKGDELAINIFKPSSFFPMSWAINETANVYFFEAMTDAEVYLAPKEETVKFIQNNPDVLFDLMKRVYKGVDGILTRMTYLMGGNAYGRLITELLIYAKRFGKGKNEVEITISEKDLAAQSGMTRETVSREMKILKDKGIITLTNSKLTIKSLQKLEYELVEIM
jgi:CRP-like cAMP-binding protein